MVATKLSPSREIAYDALALMLDKKETSTPKAIDTVTRAHNKKGGRIDPVMMQRVVTGALRWYSKLYWILQNTAKRDLDASSSEIRASLLGATYQIYYMEDIPDRTTVNESVEYLRKKGQASATSFVNGILRQISSRAEYFQKPDKNTKPVEYLSLQFAHPEWLVRRWCEFFRPEKLEVLLAANNQEPPITVRANFKKTTIKDLQLLLLKTERTHSDRRPLRLALHLKEYPRLGPDTLHGTGNYSIQDEAEQLITFLIDPKENESIALSGPHILNTLLHLHEHMPDSTKTSLVEASGEVATNAMSNLKRLGLGDTRHINANFLDWQPEEKFDKLVIAPESSCCGIFRSKPELKWLLTEAKFNGFVENQRAMLTHALKHLKPDGEIIYFVHSFDKGESEFHITQLTKDVKNQVEVVPIVARLPDYFKRYVTRTHVLLLNPGNPDETDGLAAFILRKKG
ncbi:MAG: transcription antitermination factor NusB [Oligoflexales bacterium]